MKISSVMLFVPLLLASMGTSNAANFGDEVAECAVRHGAKSGSPELGRVFELCEKEVTAKREQEERLGPDLTKLIGQFQNCLHVSAASLDDEISPASDVARAVTASCRQRWMSVLLANNEPLSRIDSYPGASITDAAIGAVLNNRSLKRRIKK